MNAEAQPLCFQRQTSLCTRIVFAPNFSFCWIFSLQREVGVLHVQCFLQVMANVYHSWCSVSFIWGPDELAVSYSESWRFSLQRGTWVMGAPVFAREYYTQLWCSVAWCHRRRLDYDIELQVWTIMEWQQHTSEASEPEARYLQLIKWCWDSMMFAGFSTFPLCLQCTPYSEFRSVGVLTFLANPSSESAVLNTGLWWRRCIT